jgi:hypothetical protein
MDTGVFGKVETALDRINQTHDADALLPAVLDIVETGIQSLEDGRLSIVEGFRLGVKLLGLIRFTKRK